MRKGTGDQSCMVTLLSTAIDRGAARFLGRFACGVAARLCPQTRRDQWPDRLWGAGGSVPRPGATNMRPVPHPTLDPCSRVYRPPVETSSGLVPFGSEQNTLSQ